jgi:hypothetical protein
MKSRNLGLGLVVLASSLFLLAGTASAHGTAPATTEETPGLCVVHSLPSFTVQGEFKQAATAADIIEVECNPNLYGTGSKIKITDYQLYNRCKNTLTWFIPNPFKKSTGPGVTVTLDAAGNATVAVLTGPGCATGDSLVVAHMEESPFESFTTSFSVMWPHLTTPGVFAEPATQVEDAQSSAVATIIQAEFTGSAEKFVHIGSEELYHRCQVAPHLHWIRIDGKETINAPEVTKVQLDNDGNAFVIAIGDASCAEGPSLIEADLESNPFTTFHSNFTVEAPRPTFGV